MKRKINHVNNTEEVNWNTKYKSETYKYNIKTIAKINDWVSHGRSCCICPKKVGRSGESSVCESISSKQSCKAFSTELTQNSSILVV